MTAVKKRRLARLLAAFKPLSIPVTVVQNDPEEPGRPLFSDDVVNRFDDGDPATLERYVLVVLDDPRFEDYVIVSFPTQRRILRELQSVSEDAFVCAFDLDRAKALIPEWHSSVTLRRRT